MKKQQEFLTNLFEVDVNFDDSFKSKSKSSKIKLKRQLFCTSQKTETKVSLANSKNSSFSEKYCVPKKNDDPNSAKNNATKALHNNVYKATKIGEFDLNEEELGLVEFDFQELVGKNKVQNDKHYARMQKNMKKQRMLSGSSYDLLD